MSGEKMLPARIGRDLYEATRPFANESQVRSWWCTGSTFVLLALVLTAAGMIPWWWARIGFSILGGLLFVRAFVIYHDFMHGAILRKSRFAKYFFYLYGLIVLTPPQAWRHSHNFHHAKVGKPIPAEEGKVSILTSDVGAVPLMTTEMWQKASGWQRLRYRINRHPLTILTAYVTVFLYSFCLNPLRKHPRKYWDAALAILCHGGVIALLWVFAGFPVAFFAFILPFAIAAATGSYLFFAQHNYEGLHIIPIKEWSTFRAALESSSYMKLSPIINWFTGNIGYHHVHHLNSLIPFYRLPEAMIAIPELHDTVITTLHLRDILTCMKLSLWDPKLQSLVTYKAAQESPKG